MQGLDGKILEMRRRIPGIWAVAGFLCRAAVFSRKALLVDKYLNIKVKKMKNGTLIELREG